MKVLRTLLVLIFFSSFSFSFSQGYNIKVQIQGLSDTPLVLGHHFNDKLFPDDTVAVNKNGVAVFKGKEAYPGGMYIVLTPSGYFDILLDTDQEFEITTTLDKLVEDAKVSGSVDNEVFFEYQNFMISKQKAMKELMDKKQNGDETEKKEVNEKMQKLNEEVTAYQKDVLAKHEGTFVADFIKATTEVEVPEPPKDADGNIIDSSFQYNYYKNHYFDVMDPSDARMLRTPLYENKIMKYIDKVLPQIPDTLIKEVDYLIEASRTNEELFRYMLITLFNHFATSKIMGMDAVYIHIAMKYYIPEAHWSSEKFINDLKETVATQEPLLIGKTAPDMELMFVPYDHFIAAEQDTALKQDPHVGVLMHMSEIQADYTVLAFWEADCGHCKKSIPKLYKIYTEELQDMGVQVLSISTLGGVDGKIKWIDFVNKHELYEWHNCWNPYSYQHKIDYDVKTTPQYYILDKNKTIIAKRVGPEDIKDIINYHKKYIAKNEQ